MKSLFVFVFAALIGCSPPTYGEIVFFDISDNNGTAGEGLENFGFFTASGVTITVSTFSASNSNSAFQANGSRGGVDNNDVDNDEILTFTFTFANPFATLNFIDLQGVGNNLSDAAFVNINGAVTTLFTGQPDFNGTTDVWTPAGGIVINSGDSIVFTAADKFGVQGIELDVEAIPECSSVFMFASAIAVSNRRRRRS